MSQAEHTRLVRPPERRPSASRVRWPRRMLIALGLGAAVVAVIVGVVATGALGGGGGTSGGGTADNAFPTSLAVVARRSLFQQTQVSATLGYADLIDGRGAGRDRAGEPFAGRTACNDGTGATADIAGGSFDRYGNARSGERSPVGRPREADGRLRGRQRR